MTAQRFAIRRSRVWLPLLLLFGGTACRSYVEISPGGVHFRFGLFDEIAPRDEVTSAVAASWPLIGGIGWRLGLGWTVGLIGARGGVVRVRFAQRRRMRFFFVPLQVREIYVSLEDPDAFLAALASR